MSMWLMYLIVKLSDIRNIAGGIAGIGTAVLGVGTLAFIIAINIHYSDECIENNCYFLKTAAPKIKSWLIKCWIIVTFFILMCFIIPTTKQAAAIYFVPKVIANKQVRKMPNKLVTLANDWMDEQIKTIKKETK